MDPVRAAIFAHLAGTPDVTGLLPAGAQGIFHSRAPLATPTPYVIFDRMSATDGYLFGDAGLERQLWLVKGIDGGQDAGQSTSVVEDLAAALEVAMHDAPLAIVGHDLLWCRRQSRVDYQEPDGLARWNHCGGVYRLDIATT